MKTKTSLLAGLLVVLVVAFTVVAPAVADEATGYIPEPEMTGTSLPYVEPYSDVGNQQRALNWRAFGLKHRPSLVRLCYATGFRPLPVWYPPRSRYHNWRDYGDACKAWALAVYRQEHRLHYQVTHPGGSGVSRWAPLLRYCGMPQVEMARALMVMRRESGGNPWATNGQYRGLYQFGWAWWGGKWNPYNPYQNVRHFVVATRHLGGWSHWAATAW